MSGIPGTGEFRMSWSGCRWRRRKPASIAAISGKNRNTVTVLYDSKMRTIQVRTNDFFRKMEKFLFRFIRVMTNQYDN